MISIDKISQLVEADGQETIATVEAALRAAGLTLGLDGSADASTTVREWLGEGARGARDPWVDPVDHVVAGFAAKLRDGRVMTLRPAPRRAIGPDLYALVHGLRGRYVELTKAWLRCFPIADKGARLPKTQPLAIERDPPLSGAEQRLFDAIDRALRPSTATRTRA